MFFVTKNILSFDVTTPVTPLPIIETSQTQNIIRMKTKVFNLIILDESGSMSCIERQALNGLNETLQTIRMAQDKFPEQEQLVSIVPFETGNIRLLRDKVSIKEVNDLTPEEYNPCGGTPLYDAIGFGISSIRKAVTDDDSVIVTIITDGEENSSKEYRGKAIATIIDKLKKKGWMFTYIGANQDAVSVAMTINITNAMNFVQDDEGTKAMFEKERRSRERYFEANAMCCEMETSDMARKARIAMACDSNYFDDPDDNIGKKDKKS